MSKKRAIFVNPLSAKYFRKKKISYELVYYLMHFVFEPTVGNRVTELEFTQTKHFIFS